MKRRMSIVICDMVDFTYTIPGPLMIDAKWPVA